MPIALGLMTGELLYYLVPGGQSSRSFIWGFATTPLVVVAMVWLLDKNERRLHRKYPPPEHQSSVE